MSAAVRRDPLLGRLKALIQKGTIPASSLSRRQRIRLAPLFESGVLEEQRAGSGRRVVVKAKVALLDFAKGMFPFGFEEGGKEPFETAQRLPRLEAVLYRRDAKAAESTWAQPVLLRGFGNAKLFHVVKNGQGILRLKGESSPELHPLTKVSDYEESILQGTTFFPVADLTRIAGLMAFRLEKPFSWGFEGQMAVVENLEMFLSFERLGLDIELVLYSEGRLSRLILEWLSSSLMKKSTVLHLGDYDPVGLAEYLRLKDAISERARLYVPSELENLIKRFGKKSLVTGQTSTLSRLRSCGHKEVERIVELLERFGCGLEQEVLLYQAGHNFC